MLQPRFFPRTQLQPRLPRNPGAPSRARVNLAGGTSGAICWTRPGWSPQTRARGRALGVPPAFSVVSSSSSSSPFPDQPPSLQLARFSGFPLPPSLLAPSPRLGDADEAVPAAAGRGFSAPAQRRLVPQARAPATPFPPHAQGCRGDACRLLPEKVTRGNFLARVTGRSV